jgi:glycerol kinase
MVGLTRGVKKEHVVRAALESIAYQTLDVIKAMEEDSGIELKELKVDGGASANNFLMQFQADILGVLVERPKVIETTALGAAYLAGLSAGYFKDRHEIAKNRMTDRRFTPEMNENGRDKLIQGWHKAVKRAFLWENSVE